MYNYNLFFSAPNCQIQCGFSNDHCLGGLVVGVPSVSSGACLHQSAEVAGCLPSDPNRPRRLARKDHLDL